MTIPCRANNCHRAAHGYSPYCQNHKQTLRRHGAAIQAGVTVQELKPYIALVEARKAKNPDSEAWGILTARWSVVVDHCRVTLQQFSEGQPSTLYARLAAHQLVIVGNDVEPWLVVRTAIAMYFMQYQRPTRFHSDTAFDFQLVRRVRGLTASNAGVTWDHKEQRSKRVYRDIPPQVVRAMAEPLKAAFGGPGLMLAAKEREDEDKARDQRRRLSDALGSLQ